MQDFLMDFDRMAWIRDHGACEEVPDEGAHH